MIDDGQMKMGLDGKIVAVVDAGERESIRSAVANESKRQNQMLQQQEGMSAVAQQLNFDHGSNIDPDQD